VPTFNRRRDDVDKSDELATSGGDEIVLLKMGIREARPFLFSRYL